MVVLVGWNDATQSWIFTEFMEHILGRKMVTENQNGVLPELGMTHPGFRMAIRMSYPQLPDYSNPYKMQLLRIKLRLFHGLEIPGWYLQDSGFQEC
jgi:hypothetical protein